MAVSELRSERVEVEVSQCAPAEGSVAHVEGELEVGLGNGFCHVDFPWLVHAFVAISFPGIKTKLDNAN